MKSEKNWPIIGLANSSFNKTFQPSFFKSCKLDENVANMIKVSFIQQY